VNQRAFSREAAVAPARLDLQGVEVAYGQRRVLHGVSFTIPPGAVTAIIGPSGCGKSTLLSALNRLSDLVPGCKVGGKVLMDGVDVFRMDPILLRRRVGMVFQKPNPFPMSIRENVLYGVKAAHLRASHNHVVQSTLTQAALWEEVRERLADHAFRLSLGQQQRLCLARCLAVTPRVVLMDEPTASLDPTSAMRIEASIRSLAGTYTLVIVTHNLQQARRVADYTAFFFDGRLIEINETARLFDRPQRELTWKYINGSLE
jgi:phosphate transport system ATP-binding protein